MDKKTTVVLEFLETQVEPMLRQVYAPDCCIAASRITLDILEHYQIPAVPIVTRLFVFNGIFSDWVREHGRLPGPEEATSLLNTGAWSVLVGASGKEVTRAPTKGLGFSGHLIVYLPKAHCIVDLSLPQATRVKQGIILSPLICMVPGDFASNGFTFDYPQRQGADLLLSYTPIKNDDYQKSVDWTSDKRNVVSLQAIVQLSVILQGQKWDTTEAATEERND